jgi:uncharacterized repeat protein (TIGR01451 family)
MSPKDNTMRISAICAALLCLVHFASAQAGINQWTTSGPPGGTYRDIKISATNTDVYYAAYSRTFFRSTDAAVSWQVSRDFVAEVVNIAVDPTDGTRVYVAALNDGLFRSDDSGQTFTKIAPGTEEVWAVGVGGADGKTVYYATNSGAFWQSGDRGQTWTQRPSTPQTITSILVDASTGNSVVALRGLAIRQSTDGGQTWTESSIGSGTNWIYSVTRSGAGKLAVATGSGIYVSPDNGATWTLEYAGSFWSVAADPASPGALVATSSYGIPAVVRRPAEGASWGALPGTPALGPAQGLIVGGGTPSRLVVANAQGVMRSTDAGTTWVESTTGPIASGLNTKMATTNAPNAKVFAYTTGGSDGLFSTTQDNGWQRYDLANAHSLVGQYLFGQSVIAIKPGSPQTVYIGAFNVGMFRSDDGGHTWTGPGTGLQTLAPYTIAFDPTNSSIMYTSVTSTTTTPAPAGLYRSTDGGVTWAPRSVNLPEVIGLRLVVDPADGNRLFLAANQGFSSPGIGGLYRSVDGGVNWTQSFNGMDVRDVAIDPSDSHRVYAATALGLSVSTDGGDSFALNTPFSIITSLPASAVAVDPVIPTTIYAASVDPDAGGLFHHDVSSHILRSVDRGQTWEVLRADTNTPNWFVGDLILDPAVPSLIYVSTSVRGIGAFEIQNDLALTLTGHSGIRPVGSSSSFDLRAENDGAFSATAVHVTVQLPAGLNNVGVTPSVGTCAVASTVVTCDVPLMAPAAAITAHVTYTPPVSMLIPVSATLSAHEGDNNATNNSATASATAGEVADLRVTVAPSANTIDTGGNLTYTVQVTNAGPSDSSAETVTLGLPSGMSLGTTLPTGCSASGPQVSCTLGALAVGASQSLSLTATANAAGSNVVSASVAGASTASDPDTSNNSQQVTVTVTTAAPPSSGSGGTGGGGGGSIDFTVLFGLLVVLARAGRVRLRA